MSTSDFKNNLTQHDTRPIGVFDSGIGGLTVLRELLRQFPNENFIYLGDTARLPYGSKSSITVRKYSEQNMHFLKSRDVKAIIVACYTASTQIFEKEFLGIPVYNVIDPGSVLAAKSTKNNKIAVLATRATIKSQSFTKNLNKINSKLEIFDQACPLFVPLAEEGWYTDSITEQIAHRYLDHLKKHSVDTVVLGCTHYPLLKDVIQKIFGTHVVLVDSGEAISHEIDSDFKSNRILKNSAQIKDTSDSILVCLTDTGAQFEELAQKLVTGYTQKKLLFETVSVIG